MVEPYIKKSVLSWNVNGSLSAKITVVEQLYLTKEIICIQEHFLSADNMKLLDIIPSHVFHFVAAKRPEAAPQVDLIR